MSIPEHEQVGFHAPPTGPGPLVCTAIAAFSAIAATVFLLAVLILTAPVIR